MHLWCRFYVSEPFFAEAQLDAQIPDTPDPASAADEPPAPPAEPSDPWSGS